jgi:hypothetical protein
VNKQPRRSVHSLFFGLRLPSQTALSLLAQLCNQTKGWSQISDNDSGRLMRSRSSSSDRTGERQSMGIWNTITSAFIALRRHWSLYNTCAYPRVRRRRRGEVKCRVQPTFDLQTCLVGIASIKQSFCTCTTSHHTSAAPPVSTGPHESNQRKSNLAENVWLSKLSASKFCPYTL